MANQINFEGKERRIAKIEKCLSEYGIESLEEAQKLCLEKGVLFSTAGKNVLRLVPPLNIGYKEIDKGLAIIKEVLEK